MSEITKRPRGRPRKDGPREANGRLKRLRPALEAAAAAAATPQADLGLEIEQMVAVGESEDVIALSLGMSVSALRADFGPELSRGRARRRREIVGLLFEKARSGNVSAQKKLEDMTGIAMSARRPVEEDQPVEKQARIGKKEEQQLAARNPDPATPMGELMARRAADAAGKIH